MCLRCIYFIICQAYINKTGLKKILGKEKVVSPGVRAPQELCQKGFPKHLAFIFDIPLIVFLLYINCVQFPRAAGKPAEGSV